MRLTNKSKLTNSAILPLEVLKLKLLNCVVFSVDFSKFGNISSVISTVPIQSKLSQLEESSTSPNAIKWRVKKVNLRNLIVKYYVIHDALKVIRNKNLKHPRNLDLIGSFGDMGTGWNLTKNMKLRKFFPTILTNSAILPPSVLYWSWCPSNLNLLFPIILNGNWEI